MSLEGTGETGPVWRSGKVPLRKWYVISNLMNKLGRPRKGGQENKKGISIEH